MTTYLNRVSGIHERSLAAETGLRAASCVACVANDVAGVVAAFSPTKGAAAAPAFGFAATVANGRINYPSTLCATVVQSAGLTNGSIRLRIRGLDMFGARQEEVTPTVNLVGKTNNHVYLAKVFSYVQSVEYVVIGLGTVTVSIGQRFDWVRTIDGANEHLAGLNLGIGIPMDLEYRPRGQPSSTRRMLGLITHPPARVASATLSIPVNPTNGDTVTIDGIGYTIKSSLGGAYTVLIGGSAAATAQNLHDAINGTGTIGVQYDVGTALHPTVSSSLNGTTLTLSARKAGAEGNVIALAETMAGVGNQFSATTLQGGTSQSGEIVGATIQDLSAAGAVTHMSRTDFTIGYSEPGWAGTPEKFSILKSAAVGTHLTADTALIYLQLRTQKKSM